MVNVAQMPRPVPTERFSSHVLRGLVAEFEAGQAPRLFDALGLSVSAEQPQWAQNCSVVVRLPESYCRLLCGGAWPTLCLPLPPREAGRSGTSAIHFRFSTLGYTGAHIPRPPRSFLPDGPGELRADPTGME
eukprot:9434179-Alexandrium_andersonii.AAC.1